jgi:hypothetical protein
MLTGKNLPVFDMIRELDQEGWVWKETGKVHINRNTQ